MRWRISIATYAYSTGNGSEADKKAAGAEDGDRYFYVDAQDFREAVKMAGCYSEAIKSHPAVWEAPIMGVNRYEIDQPPTWSKEREKHVREHTLRAAAAIARDGCLVLPDGGSPTEAETEMCDSIAAAILRLI